MITVNEAQRLYVNPYGPGYSCYGFDVVERHIVGIRAWLGSEALPDDGNAVGTPGRFAYYQSLASQGAAHAKATGTRCEADLTPELKGLEGRRVEVADSDGKRRFWVGKSTGWRPCHVEISRKNSTGGPAAFIPKDATVTVVR